MIQRITSNIRRACDGDLDRLCLGAAQALVPVGLAALMLWLHHVG